MAEQRPANCICDHDMECHGVKDGPACVGGGLAGNCQCEAGWDRAAQPTPDDAAPPNEYAGITNYPTPGDNERMAAPPAPLPLHHEIGSQPETCDWCRRFLDLATPIEHQAAWRHFKRQSGFVEELREALAATPEFTKDRT